MARSTLRNDDERLVLVALGPVTLEGGLGIPPDARVLCCSPTAAAGTA
jgi:hypothetical protein